MAKDSGCGDRREDLRHEIRNATYNIRGMLKYCKGCRKEDRLSIPHEIRARVDQIETALQDFLEDIPNESD